MREDDEKSDNLISEPESPAVEGGADELEGEGKPSEEPEATVLEEMDRLREEVDHVKELYLRKLAEFDNFRKRVDREREEMRLTAGADMVRELVPVLDNFERALQHADASGFSSFKEGIKLIAKQLWDVLSRQGLEALNPLNEKFNPEFHEAVQRVEALEHAPGSVVDVIAKGYTFGGRLVRPAIVTVAVAPEGPRKPPAAEETDNGEGEELE